MPDCIFCRIIDRQAPAKIIHEDETAIAFEDLHPQAPVHLLIVPRKHLSSLAEASPADGNLLGHMMMLAAQLARDRQLEAKGYRLVMNTGSSAGQSVFHIHFHLLGGRVFHWPPG